MHFKRRTVEYLTSAVLATSVPVTGYHLFKNNLMVEWRDHPPKALQPVRDLERKIVEAENFGRSVASEGYNWRESYQPSEHPELELLKLDARRPIKLKLDRYHKEYEEILHDPVIRYFKEQEREWPLERQPWYNGPLGVLMMLGAAGAIFVRGLLIARDKFPPKL